jgi:hypothetical protein
LTLIDNRDKKASLPSSAVHSVRDHLTTSGVESAHRRIGELAAGDPSRAAGWMRLKSFIPASDDPRSVLLVTAMDLNGIVDIDGAQGGGAI